MINAKRKKNHQLEIRIVRIEEHYTFWMAFQDGLSLLWGFGRTTFEWLIHKSSGFCRLVGSRICKLHSSTPKFFSGKLCFQESGHYLIGIWELSDCFINIFSCFFYLNRHDLNNYQQHHSAPKVKHHTTNWKTQTLYMFQNSMSHNIYIILNQKHHGRVES